MGYINLFLNEFLILRVRSPIHHWYLRMSKNYVDLKMDNFHRFNFCFHQQSDRAFLQQRLGRKLTELISFHDEIRIAKSS